MSQPKQTITIDISALAAEDVASIFAITKVLAEKTSLDDILDAEHILAHVIRNFATQWNKSEPGRRDEGQYKFYMLLSGAVNETGFCLETIIKELASHTGKYVITGRSPAIEFMENLANDLELYEQPEDFEEYKNAFIAFSQGFAGKKFPGEDQAVDSTAAKNEE